MDEANQVRVRDGRLHAERPAIVAPVHLRRMLAEGFGERALEFAEWLEQNAPDLAVLR